MVNNQPEATREHSTRISDDGSQRSNQEAKEGQRGTSSLDQDSIIDGQHRQAAAPSTCYIQLVRPRHLYPKTVFQTVENRRGRRPLLWKGQDSGGRFLGATAAGRQPAPGRRPGSRITTPSSVHTHLLPNPNAHGLTGKTARFLQWFHDPRIQQPGLTRAWRVAALQRPST